MNYTCRLWTNLLHNILVSFLLLTVIQGEDIPSRIQQSLQDIPGIHADFYIVQELNSERVQHEGLIEFMSPTQFVYKTGDIVIRVDGSSVFTYSPQYNHVIIDTYYPDEFNALTLLKGNFDRVSLGSVKEENQVYRLDFTLKETPFTGMAEFNKESLYPTSIQVDMDDLGFIQVHVSKFLVIEKSVLLEQYNDNLNEWEVLDLRE